MQKQRNLNKLFCDNLIPNSMASKFSSKNILVQVHLNKAQQRSGDAYLPKYTHRQKNGQCRWLARWTSYELSQLVKTNFNTF